MKYIYFKYKLIHKRYFIDLSTAYIHRAYTKIDISESIQMYDLDDNGYLYKFVIG